MRDRKPAGINVLALIVILGGAIAACSNGGSNNSGGAGTGGGAGAGGTAGGGGPPPGTGPGLCTATCDKYCGTDQDCNTSSGELCCDFGDKGKICQNAKACPKFCENDTMCETSMGQACVPTTLASTRLTCEPAAQGLKLCTS